jgi:protein-L-isoaspartate(D-aspartate) O-methyltransferase
MDDIDARERMVRNQLAGRGIKDPRVLDAMRAVPRHIFVPAQSGSQAYDDRPLPIGEGQTISQPYMVAVMTQVLEVNPGDHVLEIGTGSGYQTAILGTLARDVVSVERHATLADRARETLERLALTNVEVVVGDGTEGWPPRAPYDRILVTAGAPAVPEALREQLALRGRLVIPVGPPELQHLMTVTRTEDGFESRTGEACVFVPLVGRHGW